MQKKPLVALAAVTSTLILGLVVWLARPTAPSEPEITAPEITATPVTAEEESTVSVESAPALQTEKVEIQRRDTFVAALKRHGIPVAAAHQAAAALSEAGADLRRLRPGDMLELTREPEGRLLAVGYAASPWLAFTANDGGDAWTAQRTETEPEVRVEVRQGEVRNSLWDAVESGAFTPQLILDLAQMFESEFDFAVDTQPGDRFRLLVESRYADGAFVEHGRILAAQYRTAGDDKTLTGVGFEVDGRYKYYDLEGRSLKKMFLRSPLEFTRISSGFTYRRPHPILGGVRPHLAIDYAAPTGTPVWAVADGTVEFAGRKGGNGIQVLLRHRAGYRTYYNHLSRIGKGVKRGARVSQKQVVGYVGSTGLSTGPHLDYRVSRNGTFVNPLQEKFLPGEPIPATDRDGFAAQAQQLVQRLEREGAFAEPSPPVTTTAKDNERAHSGRS
jgi:murein DD-endopeptidase MepM/ murein hydrolase activator NlpD